MRMMMGTDLGLDIHDGGELPVAGDGADGLGLYVHALQPLEGGNHGVDGGGGVPDAEPDGGALRPLAAAGCDGGSELLVLPLEGAHRSLQSPDVRRRRQDDGVLVSL